MVESSSSALLIDASPANPALAPAWPLAPGRAPPSFSFGTDTAAPVYVWAASLDLPAERLHALSRILRPSERRRAQGFHFEIHRRRFIAGRGLLRLVLGRSLGVAPAQIEFAYGPAGKPALAGRFAAAGLSFNLAHCESLALLALASGPDLGLDVERVRPLPEAAELVARFFSSRESAAFQRLAPEEQPQAFFNLWTRKEAWLKATGAGIADLLGRVEVTFLPGEPARLLSLPPEVIPARPWSLYHLVPASGFVGALAVGGRASAPVCRSWDWADQPLKL
jgi:4'-phosphopantetheinyl transferase